MEGLNGGDGDGEEEEEEEVKEMPLSPSPQLNQKAKSETNVLRNGKGHPKAVSKTMSCQTLPMVDKEKEQSADVTSTESTTESSSKGKDKGYFSSMFGRKKSLQ